MLSNAPQLLDFVCIYGSHLRHLNPTSTIDGFCFYRWKVGITLIQPPFSCICHLSFFALCWVCYLQPCTPLFLFAIHHSTLRFCKILQVTIEDAWWWWKLLWRLAIEIVKLCNANMDFGLWSLGSCQTLPITTIGFATNHFHPWFAMHELFFHDRL